MGGGPHIYLRDTLRWGGAPRRTKVGFWGGLGQMLKGTPSMG